MTNCPYDYLFFDLDGTLTDPAEGITNSVAHALARYGIEVTDRTTLYPFVGPPLIETFMKEYAFTREQAVQGVGYFREYFNDRGIFENYVYPAIPEMLAAIASAGIPIILATSKPEPYAKQILEHFDLAKYFTFIGGSTMDETRTRKAEVIAYAMESIGLADPGRALMIGDRNYDIIGAVENHMDAAGVLWGYGSREENLEAGAKYVFASPAELLAALGLA